MKRSTLLSRSMAVVISLAMVMVFMPALGSVDNAYAKHLEVQEVEVKSTEAFHISVEEAAEPWNNLRSTKYEDGKGDYLLVTYSDDSTEMFLCTGSDWEFKNKDGETIVLKVDGYYFPDGPGDVGDLTDGSYYIADMFVDSAPDYMLIDRLYLTAPVYIGKPAIVNFDIHLLLDQFTRYEITENESGLYDLKDYKAIPGSTITAYYADGASKVFTSDQEGIFYDESGDEWLEFYFAWVNTEGPDDTSEDDEVRPAGYSYRCNMYIKAKDGKYIPSTDDEGDKNYIDLDIVHVPGEAVRENVVPATAQADGHYDEVVRCTVCNEEISRTPKDIPWGGSDPTPTPTPTPAPTPTLAPTPAPTPAPGPVSLNSSTVNAAAVRQALTAAGGSSDTLVLGKSVKKINKGALAGTSVKTLVVTSKKLKKKSVKGSLKGSSVKTVKVNVGKAKLNKQYVKKYKKIFTKTNCGRKVTVKKF